MPLYYNSVLVVLDLLELICYSALSGKIKQTEVIMKVSESHMTKKQTNRLRLSFKNLSSAALEVYLNKPLAHFSYLTS